MHKDKYYINIKPLAGLFPFETDGIDERKNIQDNESQMLAEAFSLLGKRQLKGIQEVHFHGKNRSLGLTPRNGVKCSLTAGVCVISN